MGMVIVNMKFLSVLLLVVVTTSAEWTCDDCNAVVEATGAYLASDDAVQWQIDTILQTVCPTLENPDECVEGIPEFWLMVARVLWPGYWNPEAEWMCAQEGLCGPPAPRDINYEECQEGIMLAIEQMQSDEFIAGIKEALSGPAFCGTEPDPELCGRVIDVLFPAVLIAFSENSGPELWSPVCNQAIPDTCPV